MAEQTQRPRGVPTARTVAEALWFPAALFLGFLFCFAPALHAPQPHHVKVAVAAPGVEDDLLRHHPGGFDVTVVADDRAARQAVLDRDVAAAYTSHGREAVLYVAQANGASFGQTLRDVFGDVAGRGGRRLTVRDLAHTVSKDLLGSTLLYFGIAWSVPAYILATTLLRAVTFSRRRKLLTIAGTAALFSVVGWVAGAALGYLPADPAAMGVAFLLTTAVSTFASGIAPFTRQFFPAVGMGLFIVLSIPTSGGVVAAGMLPEPFQHVHAVMPLANAVDALRGVLYFDGAGVLKPVLVLCAWIAGGVALMGLDAWLRNRGASGEYADEGQEEPSEPPVEDPALETPVPTALPVHRHHFGEPVPMIEGTVHDSASRPVRGAAVIIMDTAGRQLVRTRTDARGEYAATGLPEGYLTVVAASPNGSPQARQKLMRLGEVVRADFALHSKVHSEEGDGRPAHRA
ncbi:carboxypeptidase regulatory-like domain-containing protein [Streptomyces sp. NPDC060209]|uniref:carboxypeptidase regulatory-like domain-containing protein n=1 Tax=Streptomyces sp. NPDC060209 TaxID=3347073 RepID=UPI00365ED684